MKRLTRNKLSTIYSILLNAYGPRHWWPADTQFEIVIGAILTQNTAWKNVIKAITVLKEKKCLSPGKLEQIDVEILAEYIRSSGYFNQKARKIKHFLAYFRRYDYDFVRMAAVDTKVLRAELLTVHGIGPETADCILLYALDKPVFVIDAYSIRVFQRLGMVDAAITYHALQDNFMRLLPADSDMYNEYHALIDYHAHHTCRKQPLCGQCCLLSLCEHAEIPSKKQQQ